MGLLPELRVLYDGNGTGDYVATDRRSCLPARPPARYAIDISTEMVPTMRTVMPVRITVTAVSVQVACRLFSSDSGAVAENMSVAIK
jgi:hypothetical protein